MLSFVQEPITIFLLLSIRSSFGLCPQGAWIWTLAAPSPSKRCLHLPPFSIRYFCASAFRASSFSRYAPIWRRSLFHTHTQWPTTASPAITRCWRNLDVSDACRACFPVASLYRAVADLGAGGSFGVVYKAIEKATGETVAIKHVSAYFTVVFLLLPVLTDICHRLISSPAKMTFKKSSRRFRYSAPVLVPTSPNTKQASYEDTSYGSSWSILGGVLAWTW